MNPGFKRGRLGLEPSANWGANRTEAIASLYWSSFHSLHFKEPPKQMSHKSSKVDAVRLS